MVDSLAGFKFSRTEGVLEISGSEIFVQTQIDDFKELMEKLLLEAPQKVKKELLSDNGGVKDSIDDIEDTCKEDYKKMYSLVFDFDEPIRLVCKSIPGNNKAEQAKNIMRLYLYMQYLRGVEVVSADEIKDICDHHACLDKSHFAEQLQSMEAEIKVIGVKGGKKDAKLRQPGIQKVKKLAEELQLEYEAQLV